MGCLANIQKYSQVLSNHSFDFFVETGTGLGVSLEFALKFNFRELFSVEIVEELYLKSLERFKSEETVHLTLGKSCDFLDELLDWIFRSEKILFWLDAHWPGADFKIDHEDKNNPEIALPLENELKTIHKWRDGQDTIIIDDVRIYEMNPVHGLVFPREKSMRFVYSLFGQTHRIQRFKEDEGYLVLSPI
jgi:hypothetical protein